MFNVKESDWEHEKTGEISVTSSGEQRKKEQAREWENNNNNNNNCSANRRRKYSNDAAQQGRTKSILKDASGCRYTVGVWPYSQLKSAVCLGFYEVGKPEKNRRSRVENHHKGTQSTYGVGYGNRSWATLVHGRRVRSPLRQPCSLWMGK